MEPRTYTYMRLERIFCSKAWTQFRSRYKGILWTTCDAVKFFVPSNSPICLLMRRDKDDVVIKQMTVKYCDASGIVLSILANEMSQETYWLNNTGFLTSSNDEDPQTESSFGIFTASTEPVYISGQLWELRLILAHRLPCVGDSNNNQYKHKESDCYAY